MNENLKKLAHILVHYSTRIKAGENVLIEASELAQNLVVEIVKEVYKTGGFPFVKISTQSVTRAIFDGMKKEQVELMTSFDKPIMAAMHAYIGISATDNIYDLTGIDACTMQMYNSIYSKEIHRDLRVKFCKWVVLKFPTCAYAQSSLMSTQNFEDFYYKVCTLDYGKMNENMSNLKQLLDNSDRVKILSKNTELSFSIKGIDSVKCAGEMNIPDGEVYTAPVKNSVNGTITFNTPTMYNGTRFDDISLTFSEGKIVQCSCKENYENLLTILNTDDGARYIGEFAFGLNPYINSPMLDILFDEKINGSIHLALGACYDDAFNTNISSIHWDLVLRQDINCGGGEIWIDDVLIRKNGIFIPKTLQCLNASD